MKIKCYTSLKEFPKGKIIALHFRWKHTWEIHKESKQNHAIAHKGGKSSGFARRLLPLPVSSGMSEDARPWRVWSGKEVAVVHDSSSNAPITWAQQTAGRGTATNICY